MQRECLVCCCMAQSHVPLSQSTIVVVVASCDTIPKYIRCHHPCFQQRIKYLIVACYHHTATPCVSQCLYYLSFVLSWYSMKECGCHCSFLQSTVKNVVALGCITPYPSKSLPIAWRLVACALAIGQKICLMLSLLAIQHKKYALTNVSIKTQSKHKSKATSLRLGMWRAFLTSLFFEVIIPRQSWSQWKMFKGKKADELNQKHKKTL